MRLSWILAKNQYLIINMIEWFIFDAHKFSRLFSRNKKLADWYTDFKNDSLLENYTNFISQRTREALALKRSKGVILGRPRSRKSAHVKLS